MFGEIETMYQRSKIQEESLYYENLKHIGELPIMGVSYYRKAHLRVISDEVIRATEEEKNIKLRCLNNFIKQNKT